MQMSDSSTHGVIHAKPTVGDAYGRILKDLRLSLTDRCNLRCQYCMPEEIFGERFRFSHRRDLLTQDQLLHIARVFIELGVEKIRLTGGEPLLRPDLVDIVTAIRRESPTLDLALTTNGQHLESMAFALSDAGLDRVNISLDGIDDAVASAMAGRTIEPARILKAAEVARESGLCVKFNAVIKRGVNDSEIMPLAKACRERGFILRYIEYMDVGSVNGWSRKDVVSGQEIRELLSVFGALNPMSVSPTSNVARHYRYADTGLEVGFIESVTRPFCSGCTRARVSATGELFTCLFAQSGTPLKPMMATDGMLEVFLRQRWQRRDDRYSEIRDEVASAVSPHEEMWRLGG